MDSLWTGTETSVTWAPISPSTPNALRTAASTSGSDKNATECSPWPQKLYLRN